jgi:acetoacetyl-[acyl-carrier protein] synthase
VGDVFVHADGHKKSISSPGVGNYLTFAKAVAAARRILGEEAIQQRSYVHAHGTGTPQNRVTESAILDQVARAFGITRWPIVAVKCYLGHTMAAAGGDQLASSLGAWRYGLLPGIATIDRPAEDVRGERLHISPRHLEGQPDDFDLAFLNAKGFGGNNATASVYGPHVVERLLEKKLGAAAVTGWRHRVEETRERAEAYDQAASEGRFQIVYRFDHEVRHDEHVRIDAESVTIQGYRPIPI